MDHAGRHPQRLLRGDHVPRIARGHLQHAVGGEHHLVPVMRMRRETLAGGQLLAARHHRPRQRAQRRHRDFLPGAERGGSLRGD